MAETASGFFERSAVLTRLVYARRRRLLRVSPTPAHGLIAETVALSEVPDVLALISSDNPLLWWRRGAGMVVSERQSLSNFQAVVASLRQALHGLRWSHHLLCTTL
jgi:hypothetical protein